MIKKKVLFVEILFIFSTIIMGLAIYVYLLKVDTIFAQKFSKVMNSHDIAQIDKYFTDDTIFICNGKSDTYVNLKKNIMNTSKEKKFTFYSYGNGDNKFVNNLQEVSIIVYGTYNNHNIGEGLIEMTLKKSGLFKITIESVKCDDPFFEAIFFNNLS